jgi:carbon-monoxide dehydrogenase medium subunit
MYRSGGCVKPAAFAYAKSTSVAHAIELLATEGSRILAGGQSLIATLNMRLDAPSLLIDINGIPDLDKISLNGTKLEMGALVRHAQAMASPLVREHAPLLALAYPHIAHAAIRNRGTIGGSLALADPAAELPACLLALGGEVEITGAGGKHTVAADDFFHGLFETAIGPDEILTAVRLPAATKTSRYGFAELARRHGDYALVGLAASAEAEGATLGKIRLAYFGVGATPVRAQGAEAALSGKALDDANLSAAVAALAADLDPEDDIHSSRKAKMHLAGVLLRRVVAQMRGTRA